MLTFINVLIMIFSFSNCLLRDNENLDIDISRMNISSQTDQIILVIPEKYTSSIATLYFYVKESSQWKLELKTLAYIGKDGLGLESEDDSKSPVGLFKFNFYFGINEKPPTSLPYVKVNNSHYWISDPASDKYNHFVNIDIYKEFDINKSEHLIEVVPGYQYAMNINYNEDCIPGRGSAIFLHCFTEEKYTGGCVAVSEDAMKFLFGKINTNCNIIIDVYENVLKYYRSSNKSNKLEFVYLAFLFLLFI